MSGPNCPIPAHFGDAMALSSGRAPAQSLPLYGKALRWAIKEPYQHNAI
jgi:hypothetical protein